MKHIYFLGECMVELRSIEEQGMENNSMAQSFAGDIYNSAVYLKRCFSDICTSMVTTIGRDTLSNQMLACFESEHLETQCVFRHANKAPGMYLIETDAAGERRFTYWRNDSAARRIMDFINEDVTETLTCGDMFFFSGISLAVIEPLSRDLFWQRLQVIRAAGVKIVFDPNYRSRLWQDSKEAKIQFENALAMSDVTLPGLEDLSMLYGLKTAEQAMEFCQSYGPKEIIVKNGSKSVLTLESGSILEHPIQPASNVVDTTSAGDAFNGVYLGARLSDITITRAVQLAAAAAATVIQHPGAIAPVAAFKLAMIEAGL